MTADIEAALARAERALDEGRGIGRTGFWPAVAQVRADHELAATHADRIAAIDRRAFEAGVRMRIPAGVGLVGLALMTAIGAGLLAFGSVGCQAPDATLAVRTAFDICEVRAVVPITFLAGFVAILVGSHSLAHFVVGRAVGMRFTHVFLGGPPPPRPGVKTDYASYLRTPPRARALMHASGAIVTKLVPFALLPLVRYDEWPWLAWILVGVGVVGIVTDVFLSTKLSDWKKVRRELACAEGW